MGQAARLSESFPLSREPMMVRSLPPPPQAGQEAHQEARSWVSFPPCLPRSGAQWREELRSLAHPANSAGAQLFTGTRRADSWHLGPCASLRRLHLRLGLISSNRTGGLLTTRGGPLFWKATSPSHLRAGGPLESREPHLSISQTGRQRPADTLGKAELAACPLS